MVNIKGLDKAKVLAALHRRAKQQGMGFLQSSDFITRTQAKAMLLESTYFDYLSGRVMKVDLKSDDEFDPRLYDRDNGAGAAAEAIDTIRT